MFPGLNISLFSVLSVLILILIPVIYHEWFSKKHENLPPSPWKLPIIGNFHQLGIILPRSLWKLAKKHGPLMLLHLGSVPVLIVSSADAAREVLKTHEFAFSDRGELGILRKLAYDGKDIALSDYGEHWRQLKSLVVIHLLSNKRVQSFQHVREEEIALTIQNIRQTCGSVIDFTEVFLSLISDVLCRVTLGKKYSDRRLIRIIEEFNKLVVILSVGQFIPWLSWVDKLRGLNVRTEKVAKEFDEFLEGVIEERESSIKGANMHVDDDEVKYFIDILLEKQIKEDADSNNFPIDRDTVKAVIVDMFAGATGTTLTTLEWALSELVRNPRVMNKLQKELKLIAQGKPNITEEDIGKLEYLKAVFKETMRLHTPSPLFIRASSQDVKLMGHDIKAETRVFINTWALGQDPMIWEEHKEFKPERFLDSPLDYKGNNYEFIPFGAGRRSCPGIRFANTLMELALANVLYKFDLAHPGGERGNNLDMSESMALTMHRKNHLLLVATPHSE